jgi:hypothetical protein
VFGPPRIIFIISCGLIIAPGPVMRSWYTD